MSGTPACCERYGTGHDPAFSVAGCPMPDWYGLVRIMLSDSPKGLVTRTIFRRLQDSARHPETITELLAVLRRMADRGELRRSQDGPSGPYRWRLP